MNNEKLKKFILQISAEAGDFLRNHFYTFKNVFHKDVGSLVTNIDLELEDMLIKRIRKEYPKDGIIVQGSKTIHDDAKTQWIIDPLEGSSHFSRNIPVYTSNIAIQQMGKTILAAVNHPQTHQLFFAEKNYGAYLNGIDISVSEQSDLSKSYIFVELPEKKYSGQKNVDAKFSESLAILEKLLEKGVQVESFRIGAIGQCLVASGSFDAYIDLSGTSQAQSHAASQLIVEEAGGTIIDLKKPKDGFVQVMVANNGLSQSLLKIIR